MTQSASHASSGSFLDTYDFSLNYKYLKKLIEELKTEDSASVKKEIFGEETIQSHVDQKADEASIPVPEENRTSLRGMLHSAYT